MKPLRETFEASDPNEKLGSALLTEVGPLESSAARKRRVWLALEAHQGGWRMWLRPVVTGAVVLGLCTGASAMVGRRFMRSRAPDVVLNAARTADPPAPTPATLGHGTPRGEPAAEVPAPQAWVVPAPEVPSRAPSLPASARIGHAAKDHRAAAAPSVETPAPSVAAMLMVEAMQARRSGDLARAGQLASEYRRRFPDGALREEALALSLEVAAARGDKESARLAEQYLVQFPGGRFRAQAERALQAVRR